MLANLLFEKIAQSLVLTLPKFNVHHSLDNYIPKRVNKLLFLPSTYFQINKIDKLAYSSLKIENNVKL